MTLQFGVVRARASTYALHLYRARDLARDLAQACDLAFDLACRDVDFSLAGARDLANARDRAHGILIDLLRDRNRHSVIDLGLARDRTHNVLRELGVAAAPGRSRELSDLVETAIADASQLDCVLQLAVHEQASGDNRSLPGPIPQGVVALAVRMLPTRDRPRYAEEFRGELGELSRQQRWKYALRTLAGSWLLRRALLERRSAPSGERRG